LREAFLETEENVAPLAELLLFAADRAQHVNFQSSPRSKPEKSSFPTVTPMRPPLIKARDAVLTKQTIKQVIELATDGLKPDLTLFFDVPVEKAIARTNSRTNAGEQKNRMDSETVEFYERVRRAYLKIAENEPQRFRYN
jgi:dTMP kinase